MDFILKKQAIVLIDAVITIKSSLFSFLRLNVYLKKSVDFNYYSELECTKRVFKKKISKSNYLKPTFLGEKGKITIKSDFKKSDLFVLNLPDAKILLNGQSIVSNEGIFLTEVNPYKREYSKYYPLDYKIFFPKYAKFNEALLCMFSNNNYYHWMFEVLPRYQLAKESGFSFSKILVSSKSLFQSETLNIMGIRESDLLDPNKNQSIIASNAIVPSLPCYPGEPNEWVCKFLRNQFLSKSYNKERYSQYSKIYVSRGKSKNGRCVFNEHFLINALSKLGFTKVSLDGLSVVEQAKIFNSARVIVAYHGGALSNLVFCKPGAKVIEIVHPEYINPCFWHICKCINLNHFFVLAKSFRKTGLDIMVDSKLVELIKKEIK